MVWIYFFLRYGSFLKLKNQIVSLLDNAFSEAPENRKRGNCGKIWTNEGACSRSPSKQVADLGKDKYWVGKWALWKCQGPKHMFHFRGTTGCVKWSYLNKLTHDLTCCMPCNTHNIPGFGSVVEEMAASEQDLVRKIMVRIPVSV